MREGVIVSVIVLLFFIAGCAQQEPTPTMTCEEYCEGLPHTDCEGNWSISGTYPDCACSWVCGGGVTNDSCTPSWSCTDWSECNSTELQVRTCTDINNCNTTLNKPDESQSCDYTSECDLINDATIKAECLMLEFEDPDYCSDTAYESCLYDLAQITFNESLCDEINLSFSRNTCRAIVNNDRTYCNILQPSQRLICLNSVDAFLSNRGDYENNKSYCDLINNSVIKSSCYNKVSLNDYYDYRSNYTVCERFNYTYNSSDYQEIYSCYAYHAENTGSTACEGVKNVVNLTSRFYTECNELVSDDITYCYDFNGTRRDYCFAHFAYVRDDKSVCLDANNTNNCYSIAGRYFDKIDFCDEIDSTTVKNTCVYTVATRCLTYDWKSCNVGYCDRITDNAGLKNVCIYNVVNYDAQRERNFTDYV